MKICNYFKIMVTENVSQQFRLKNIDETRNYFLEEIEQNELMSRKVDLIKFIEDFSLFIKQCYRVV